VLWRAVPVPRAGLFGVFELESSHRWWWNDVREHEPASEYYLESGCRRECIPVALPPIQPDHDDGFQSYAEVLRSFALRRLRRRRLGRRRGCDLPPPLQQRAWLPSV
jgi:hypothetical protein